MKQRGASKSSRKLIEYFHYRNLHEMILYLVNKLKAVTLGLLGLLSKIICCFKRRRRNSDQDIPVNIHQSSSSRFINDVAAATNWDDDDWDSCEIVIDKQNSEPRTTSDHIAAYRQQLVTTVRQNSVPEASDEPDIDLFEGMAPDITKQRKVFIGQDSPGRDVGSRLTVINTDPITSLGAELENWEDNTNTGWDDQENDLTETLRSHKRGGR